MKLFNQSINQSVFIKWYYVSGTIPEIGYRARSLNMIYLILPLIILYSRDERAIEYMNK